MSYKLDKIEGIGPTYRDILITANIRTTGDLLKTCGNLRGREAVAARTGLSKDQLLKWVNLADLMRISGVGGEFSELLEAAGVDTVRELKMRTAVNLALKMREINHSKKLTRAVPALSKVEKWIEQAKTLEPLISH